MYVFSRRVICEPEVFGRDDIFRGQRQSREETQAFAGPRQDVEEWCTIDWEHALLKRKPARVMMVHLFISELVEGNYTELIQKKGAESLSPLLCTRS